MKRRLITLFTILLSFSLIATYSCKKEKDKSVAVTEVRLNKTATTLVEGDTEELIATVMPENATDKSVVWESSNETVVTVEQDGLVKAVREGDAQITVTAKNGVSASCLVGVSKKDIPVTGIKLNYISMELNVGTGGKLTATVEPENATVQDVEWKSSDPAVVAVHNGYVTAKSEGKATITVTTVDGGFTASCEVNVKNIPVTGIVLEQPSLLLPVGNTYTLRAHVQPSNATDQNIKWISNNEGVATVDQTGKVTAVTAGTADIRALLAGKLANCTVQVDNVKLSMKTSSYNILPMTKLINIKSNIDANFELDYSKFSFSYSDPEVATIKSNFDIALHGKKGTTKVNVLYKYGNGELKTSFTITVK